MKRGLKITFGIMCVVVGFLALITPLTPGSWLIFVGAELLGIRFLLRARRTVQKAADGVKNAARETAKSAVDGTMHAAESVVDTVKNGMNGK